MAGPTTDLIIETPDGSRYGVKSLEAANRLHAGSKVISYADGRPFEGEKPAPKPAAKPTRTRAPRKPKTTPTTTPDPSGNAPETNETGDGAG